jgi:leader peptidase (prepilin peptidase)/N-methyltransferase
VRPRSACDHCGAPISSRDNIPVLSYLLLRGRCRSCGEPIGLRSPVVELVTALLVAACALVFGLTLEAAVAAFFCCTLVAVSAVDLERFIIPNRIVLPATVVVLVAQTALEPSPEWILAGLGASGFLLVAALAYPAGMGMGDVKLALLLGVMLGRTVPVALMIGMLAALVPAVYLLARHGSAGRKMKIPFGPFLALGGVVTLFAGDAILGAYLGVL